MIILLSLNEGKVGGSNSISRFLNKYFIVSKIIYIVQAPNFFKKGECTVACTFGRELGTVKGL